MATLDMNLIFEEILPRLPAKSLVRFKSVSKSFQAAISSREFAQLYLHHQSLSSDDHDIIILQNDSNIRFYDCNSRTFYNSFLNFVCYQGLFSLSAVGFFKRMFCAFVVDFSDYFAVLTPYSHLSLNTKPGPRVGFAFDHINLDYKLVLVTDEYDSSGAHFRITRVYSFNTKTWSASDIRAPVDTMEGRHDTGHCALVNDHLLHWIFKNPSKEASIGCFDVCKMKWTDNVLLPRYHYDPTHKNSLLDFGVFDECLFSLFENRVDSRFDVWVMKEYGVQDSWFKFLSISISDDFKGGVVPITCSSGSNEVLIRHRRGTRLYWYNKASGGTREAYSGAPKPRYHPTYNYPIYSLPNSIADMNHPVYNNNTCCNSIVEIPSGILFWDIIVGPC
ncbi:F-box/kelch-repeat protein At3g23880-like [Silene latifolia]|uniref:F-box/kelch-repeat protein At3g23880-like n=1 Tax=Silene latifolia TaxID=37657 RepID=UPI003D7793CB